MTLNISGIPVEVCKKDIKNMHLYVKSPDGFVTLSAPYSMSDEAIERFLIAKIGWIKKQIAKFDGQPRQIELKYVSGETLYILGKLYHLQTACGSKNSMVLSSDKALLTVRKNSTVAQREKCVREWYRELLKAEIKKSLPKWEKITGLKANDWQIKYMTTRWGTCNIRTRKIWLNLQLAQKTPECLEYVILHELIHLIEKNHNKQFALYMDKYMPMWREIKATLNGQKP